MTVASWFALAVGVQYLCASAADLYLGKYGYSLMWFSYALANVGLILSVRGV